MGAMSCRRCCPTVEVAAIVCTILLARCAIAVSIEQVAALQEFALSTEATGWLRNWGWTANITTSAVCSDGSSQLYGIVCNAYDVIGIILPSNNLNGTIPKDFFKVFPNISTVNMPNNPLLLGAVPAFAADSGLTEFIAGNCGFNGSIPQSIFTATLSQLHLDSNRLTQNLSLLDFSPSKKSFKFFYAGNNSYVFGDVSPTICECTSLMVFDVMLSYASSLPQCFAENMPNLQVINLFRNSLGGTLPSAWCNPTHLKVLQVQDNPDLGGTLPDCITNWKEIQTLAIENTAIGGTIPEGVFQLSSLLNLILSLSQFEGEIPDLFGGLKSLIVVTLNGNPNGAKYNGSLPSSLFELRNLTTLSIQYTDIEGPVPSFSGLRSLWKVSLANNRKMRAKFPTELLTDVWILPPPGWNTLWPPPPKREIHLENSAFFGSLPRLDKVFPTYLSDIAMGITLYSNSWQGFIPNSTLEWIPHASWPGVLKQCNELLFPVGSWNLPLTNQYQGLMFSLLSVEPSALSMSGGETITITGSNFYEFPGRLFCGFCAASTAVECLDVKGHFQFTLMTYDEGRQVALCSTPPITTNSSVLVTIVYRGPTYGDESETVSVSGETYVMVRFYNPHPTVLYVAPSSGRKEGCTTLTVHGRGFLNAPNVSVKFGNDPGAFTAGNGVVFEDNRIEIVLPFADNSNTSVMYNVPYGVQFPVRVFPNGFLRTESVTTANYSFARSCATPLAPCPNYRHDIVDPDNCPTPMCRCSGSGFCRHDGPNRSFVCHCLTGYSGDACDACEPLRYGGMCLQCQCVKSHGTCEDGISQSGKCDCTSVWTDSTCSTNVVLLAVFIPVSVALVLGVTYLLYSRRETRNKIREEMPDESTPLNSSQ